MQCLSSLGVWLLAIHKKQSVCFLPYPQTECYSIEIGDIFLPRVTLDILYGPYFEWTRRQGGRLVHSVLSAEQADRLARAITNYREVQRLLAAWERESAAEILAMKARKV